MLGRFKRKLSRTKSASDPSDEPQGLNRGFSLTPSDEILIGKLAFTPDTKSETKPPTKYDPSINTNTSRSERTVINRTDRGFLSLPNEVLLCLKPYLRPSTEVALRHACSRFFYLYSMPSFYLSGNEKFDFICMTERDQDPTQLDKLVCGRCRELHVRSSFPTAEVKQTPLERDCRQIWLCAHRSLGYRKTIKSIKAGVEGPFKTALLEPCSRCRDVIRNRSIADRPEKGTSEMDLESPKAESLLVSKVAIMQRPAPVYNPRAIGGTTYKEVFGAKEVSDALQAINFRICPHITLGDPCILSKFCRSCLNTQRLPPGVKGPPCISAWNQDVGDRQEGRCRGSCFDRSCRTKWMFQAREGPQADASGRRPIWLIISTYRWLGPLMSVGSDSSWRDHATDHNDRVDMRKKWDTWSKGQLPMPNWSISLWHPDDCTLR